MEPWKKPDPCHSHPHEQTSYLAFVKIPFICEHEKQQHLKAGDMSAVPSDVKHTIKLLIKEARIIDSFKPLKGRFSEIMVMPLNLHHLRRYESNIV